MGYKYTNEIEIKLRHFEKYLRSKKYALDTIRQTRNYAGVYLEWLEVEKVESGQVDYELFTDFIFHLKQTRTESLTRRIILAVRHYYNSLEIDKNPASGIHIKGRRKSVVNNIVPFKELQELYDNYQILDDRDSRNKVILGLLIYQGMTTSELQKLEPRHIKIEEGKIYIPGQVNSKSRILALATNQLLDLQKYLVEIRPRMLSNIEAQRPGRKPEKVNPIINEKLFFSEVGSERMKNSIYHLFRSVKKFNPKISSGKIIRSTVIANWLKTKDVRIVQYMAGHRWVSSTERYNVLNLQELKESLKKYHPLN